MLTVRVREGMTETRGMKSITAVPDVTDPAPPFTLRLFLHGWGLVAVAGRDRRLRRGPRRPGQPGLL